MARTLWLVLALLLPLLGGCALFDSGDDWDDECTCGYPATYQGPAMNSTPAPQVLPGPAR